MKRVISLDEVRALREQQRADERHEAERHHIDPRILELIRAYVTKLQGGDGIHELTQLGKGLCDDCLYARRFYEHDETWELGVMALCRACVISRIRVAVKLGLRKAAERDG